MLPKVKKADLDLEALGSQMFKLKKSLSLDRTSPEVKEEAAGTAKTKGHRNS